MSRSFLRIMSLPLKTRKTVSKQINRTRYLYICNSTAIPLGRVKYFSLGGLIWMQKCS